MAVIEPLFGLNVDSARGKGPAEQAEPDTGPRKQLARRPVDTSRGDSLPDHPQFPIPAESKPPARRRIEQRLTVITPGQLPAQKEASPPPNFALPPLPSGDRPRSYGSLIGFALCVALPVFVASLYYGFIASNQYVAEFRFTVKDAATNANPAAGGLLALAGNLGGGDSTNNYLVADFLTSREAIEKLQKSVDVVGLYAKPDVDWWSRFNPSQPLERFVLYWQHMVTAHYDPVTGIATAAVRAFSPQDALLIANSLVALSEELVNQIANRSQRDNVRFAEAEVGRAEKRLKDVQARMTEYRNRVGVINPAASVVASNSTLVQTLQGNLAQLQTQLDTLKNQNLAPNAPAIVTLNNQIKSVKEQLQITEAAVGKSRDGTPLSSVMGEYEQLDLERQFAQTMVTSSMQALDQARATAAAQHLYITPYVRPSLPQSSTYPQRFLSVVSVGAVAFAAWLIGLLTLRSIRERFA